MARQPIFDINRNVIAYELLFRSNNFDNNFDNNIDGDKATSNVIVNSFLLIGIDKLTNGKKAFINFTKKLLLNDTALVLPNKFVTVEILENIEPTEELILSCKKLKNNGYTIALDDFVFNYNFEELIKLANIIKIDFNITKSYERSKIIKRIKSINKNIKFLAEKVETIEDFNEAVNLGYSFFQGYFFSKPIIVNGQDIPMYNFSKYNILKQINKKDLSFEDLEKLIKSDLSLSYKLFKFVNSAAFSTRQEITSVNRALTLLGKKEVVKLISLILLNDVTNNNMECSKLSLIRGKFMELLSCETKYKERADELFFMGMFSNIDKILNKPLDEILNELAIANDIKMALLGVKNNLYYILNIVLNYEKGNFDTVNTLSHTLNINQKKVPHMYLDTLDWVNKLYILNKS